MPTTLNRVLIALTVGAATLTAAASPADATTTVFGSPADAVDALNAYRTASGLAPTVLSTEPGITQGVIDNSCWSAENNILTHTPANTSIGGWTALGDAAARRSNIAMGFGSVDPSYFIDLWMTAPYHAAWMLNPGLTETSYGQCGHDFRTAATLDVGAATNIGAATQQVLFPGPGSTVDINRFIAESPNPLDNCGAAWNDGGAGLPLIATFPNGVAANTTASLTGPDGQPMSVCVITELTDTNSIGASILGANNAVLIIADQPLGDGTYTANAQTGSDTATWSFTIGDEPADTVVIDPTADLIPIRPERVVDTRTGTNITTTDGAHLGAGRQPASSVYRFSVRNRAGIPADASAVALNVVAAGPGTDGFLTVHPCSKPRPNASTLNYVAGTARANEVLAQLDATGEICVFTRADTDLVVDVTGYTPATSKVTSLVPARLVDTRTDTNITTTDGAHLGAGRQPAGSVYSFDVAGRGGIPLIGVDAATLNVVAASPTAPGFLTVYPCGTRPNASSLNHTAGGAIANEQVVKLDSTGKVCIFTLAPTHLVVDVTGYIETSADVTSITPTRLLETRTDALAATIDGTSERLGRLTAGQTIRFKVAGRGGIPANATAATLNIAAIAPDGPGFVTVYPCGTRPNASSLNHTAGEIIANEVVAKLDNDGHVCAYTLTGTHLIADATAYTK